MVSTSSANLRLHMKGVHDLDVSNDDSILIHFIRAAESESSAKCMTCGKVLRLGKTAPTTNLREHMKRMHKIHVPMIAKKPRSNKL